MVTPDKVVAINEGKVTPAGVLTTDWRRYANSASVPLPSLLGPAILYLPIKVSSGAIGVVLTSADDNSDVVVSAEVSVGASGDFVILPVADIAEIKAVTFLNRSAAGASSAAFGVIQILRSSDGSFVPARGVRLEPAQAIEGASQKTAEGIFKPRGVDEGDLASVAILHDDTAATAGMLKVRATTEGFDGMVRVVDNDGATIAKQPLPLVTTPDIVEVRVPNLAAAADLVFSSRGTRAKGELRVESVVAFAADGQ